MGTVEECPCPGQVSKGGPDAPNSPTKTTLPSLLLFTYVDNRFMLWSSDEGKSNYSCVYASML